MLVTFLQLVLVVKGTIIDKVVRLDEDQVLDDLNFESGFGSWEHSNLKLVNTNQTEYSMLNSLTPGMVVVPQTSLTGDQWGKMERDLNLPAHMQVKLEFNLFVSGFNISAEASIFLPDQPDLVVTLTNIDQDEEVEQVVTNLHSLNPPSSKWTRYQTSVTTDSRGTYRFSLATVSGGEGGVIALDDIRLKGYPLVGKEYEEEEEEDTDSNQSNQEDDIDSTQSNNTLPNSSSNITENGTPTNTTDNTDSTEEIIPIGGDLNTTFPTNVTSSNSSTALQDGSPQISPDSSGYPVYGYTSQVILICLTVLFGVLTVVVGYKYHRLRSHAGDYRLSPNQ